MIIRIIYDREVDALYIRFKETTVTTKQLAGRLSPNPVDYNAANHLAGIEILDAAQRLDNPDRRLKQVDPTSPSVKPADSTAKPTLIEMGRHERPVVGGSFQNRCRFG